VFYDSTEHVVQMTSEIPVSEVMSTMDNGIMHVQWKIHFEVGDDKNRK